MTEKLLWFIQPAYHKDTGVHAVSGIFRIPFLFVSFREVEITLKIHHHTSFASQIAALLLLLLWLPFQAAAQKPLKVKYTNGGIFSLGVRVPFAFAGSPDGLNGSQGFGLSSRVQLGYHYNTEFYGEYLKGRYGDNAIKGNAHIGGSFILCTQHKLRRVQPIFFAGPDADFEQVHETIDKSNAASRWNFAAHAGMGMHINVSWRSDITVSTSYMMHFGPKIETISSGDQTTYTTGANGVDGQFMITISMNYKMLDLWKKIQW
ncbi:MAG: hypothetical protein K1X61_16070 [Chitinophagales bacterium]|nr:hypothetical protein [Chitinophagales bacterium]